MSSGTAVSLGLITALTIPSAVSNYQIKMGMDKPWMTPRYLYRNFTLRLTTSDSLQSTQLQSPPFTLITHMFHHLDFNHWIGNIYTTLTVGVSLNAGFLGTLFIFLGGGLTGVLSQTLDRIYISKSQWLPSLPKLTQKPVEFTESPLGWLMNRISPPPEVKQWIAPALAMCGSSAGVYALIGAEFGYLTRQMWRVSKKAARARKGSEERERHVDRLWRLTSIAVGHVVNIAAQVVAVSSPEGNAAVGYSAHLGGFVFGWGVSGLIKR
ncbi:hypothetical protein HDU97_009464 [Phlyctochytrium planicorne]|nr:hypothetical protein HDU97_009464 [Phlyctochytrium planicorne]